MLAIQKLNRFYTLSFPNSLSRCMSSGAIVARYFHHHIYQLSFAYFQWEKISVSRITHKQFMDGKDYCGKSLNPPWTNNIHCIVNAVHWVQYSVLMPCLPPHILCICRMIADDIIGKLLKTERHVRQTEKWEKERKSDTV